MKRIIGITLAYFLLGILWIFTTDRFSEKYFDHENYTKFQTYKDLLFVLISAIFVFFSIWYFYRRLMLENNQSRIFKKIQDIIIENSKSFTWIYNIDEDTVSIRGRMSDQLITGATVDLKTLIEFYESRSTIKNFHRIIEDFKSKTIDTLHREYRLSFEGKQWDYKLYITSLENFEGSNYLISHSENITEYKKMVEQIKDNNKMLNSILHSIPDILMIIENQTYIVKFIYSKDAVDMLASPDEVTGKDLRMFLPKYLKEMLEEKFSSDVNLEQPLVYELNVNNKTKYFEARFLMYDPNSTMIIVRNITKEHELNIERQIYLEQL